MISGKVFDSETNKPIWNANIFVSDASGKITKGAIGTTSWFDGTYKLDIKDGEYITCSCVGYVTRTFEIGSWPIIHFEMFTKTTDLPMVEIVSTPIDNAKKILNYVIAGFALGLGGLLLKNLTNSKNSHSNGK